VSFRVWPVAVGGRVVERDWLELELSGLAGTLHHMTCTSTRHT